MQPPTGTSAHINLQHHLSTSLLKTYLPCEKFDEKNIEEEEEERTYRGRQGQRQGQERRELSKYMNPLAYRKWGTGARGRGRALDYSLVYFLSV